MTPDIFDVVRRKKLSVFVISATTFDRRSAAGKTYGKGAIVHGERRQSPIGLKVLIAITWLLVSVSWSSLALAQEQLWQALQAGRHVALLRHAIAPGTGDPDHFDIDDCSTQRNLSERGRAQAARIGARFKTHGIERADVYSSQWCRCIETARNLDLGEVRKLSLLNSFFEQRDRGPVQTDALRRWLHNAKFDRPKVLVTHQVNITALTGIVPTSGELVIVRVDNNGTISPTGTIKTD